MECLSQGGVNDSLLSGYKILVENIIYTLKSIAYELYSKLCNIWKIRRKWNSFYSL